MVADLVVASITILVQARCITLHQGLLHSRSRWQDGILLWLLWSKSGISPFLLSHHLEDTTVPSRLLGITAVAFLGCARPGYQTLVDRVLFTPAPRNTR